MIKQDWADRAAKKLLEESPTRVPCRYDIANALRRAEKRGYERGVVAMATRISQATDKKSDWAVPGSREDYGW